MGLLPTDAVCMDSDPAQGCSQQQQAAASQLQQHGRRVTARSLSSHEVATVGLSELAYTGMELSELRLVMSVALPELFGCDVAPTSCVRDHGFDSYPNIQPRHAFDSLNCLRDDTSVLYLARSAFRFVSECFRVGSLLEVIWFFRVSPG